MAKTGRTFVFDAEAALKAASETFLKGLCKKADVIRYK